MRTKTLLLAAATIMAGLVSSQADTVYSQNVVGYINVPVAAGKFVFLGNQLVNGSDAAKTDNNIQAVLATGLVSDPNGANNSVVYYWNGAGYNIYSYYIAADADNQFGANSGNGWYTDGGVFANVSLYQGTNGGNFLKNPSAAAITVTLVGTVLQGTNTYGIKPGFNTYTLPEPVSTNLNSVLVNFPGTSDPNGALNDVYYHFKADGSGYDILSYYTDADALNQFGSSSGNGWYTDGGVFGSANPALWPKVGEGFFINHVAATTVTWTNIFNVQ